MNNLHPVFAEIFEPLKTRPFRNDLVSVDNRTYYYEITDGKTEILDSDGSYSIGKFDGELTTAEIKAYIKGYRNAGIAMQENRYVS